MGESLNEAKKEDVPMPSAASSKFVFSSENPVKSIATAIIDPIKTGIIIREESLNLGKMIKELLS